VMDTREFRKFARRLRERRRKEGRVRQIAREMTKSPAVIITEEPGKNLQEEMIGLEEEKVKKRELRHRIKQTPFKKLLKTGEGGQMSHPAFRQPQNKALCGPTPTLTL